MKALTMMQVESTRNGALQMKAYELERLFEQHQLQGSSRRSPVDIQVSSSFYDMELTCVTSASSNMAEFDVDALIKVVLGTSHYSYSKGEFYDEYMEKRDARLREGFYYKEEKMQAMYENFERATAEMKRVFTCRDDSARRAYHRDVLNQASFSINSAIRSIEQPMTGSYMSSTDDEYQSDFAPQSYGLEGSFSRAVLPDGSTRSSQPKKLLRNKTVSSTHSTPSIPRPSVKSTTSFSGRRRVQPETLTATNLSDFRKENTKPSLGISRTPSYSQYAMKERSKSVREVPNHLKEDSLRRSQTMRKSTVSHGEIKESPPPNSERYRREQTINRIPKTNEPKRILKNGNGMAPGHGAGFTKMKATQVQPENEEYEKAIMGEHAFKDIYIPSDSDDRLSLSGGYYESEYMESPRSYSQKPVEPIANTNSYSPKNVTKGFKKFLKFGKKNHGNVSVEDSMSLTNSPRDDHFDNGLSDDLSRSRMRLLHGQASYHQSFHDVDNDDMFGEQVEGSYSSIPTTKYKLRKDLVSGSYTRAPRPFFSLCHHYATTELAQNPYENH